MKLWGYQLCVNVISNIATLTFDLLLYHWPTAWAYSKTTVGFWKLTSHLYILTGYFEMWFWRAPFDWLPRRICIDSSMRVGTSEDTGARRTCPTGISYCCRSHIHSRCPSACCRPWFQIELKHTVDLGTVNISSTRHSGCYGNCIRGTFSSGTQHGGYHGNYWHSSHDSDNNITLMLCYFRGFTLLYQCLCSLSSRSTIYY